jgi:hypothetical protein
VPKAAVHEDADTLFPENKIGIPGQFLFSPPATDPVCPQYFNETQLGRLVAV